MSHATREDRETLKLTSDISACTIVAVDRSSHCNLDGRMQNAVLQNQTSSPRAHALSMQDVHI